MLHTKNSVYGFIIKWFYQNLVCEIYYTFSAKQIRDVPKFIQGARSSYLKGNVYINCASDMWNCFNIVCTVHNVKFSS